MWALRGAGVFELLVVSGFEFGFAAHVARFVAVDSSQTGRFIYQLIYPISMQQSIHKKRSENPFVRSPTLGTVMMVERVIEKNSGEYNRTDLWKNLPKQVMWQTFLVILDYLETINKIAFDREGKIAYIWNPGLAKKLSRRKEIKI